MTNHDRFATVFSSRAGQTFTTAEITEIMFIDYQQRYRKQAAPQKLTSADCQAYINPQIEPYTKGDKSQSPTMQALRRIWKWSPEDETHYTYPSQSWFKANPKEPIAQTP